MTHLYHTCVPALPGCIQYRDGDCPATINSQVRFVAGKIPGDFSKISGPGTCSSKREQQMHNRVFLIAGQSNAEGQVKLEGLRKLAKAIPVAVSEKTSLPEDVKKVGRQAWLESQGTMCNNVPEDCKNDISSEGCPEVYKKSADAVIAGLHASTTDWRSFTSSYKHKSVKVRRAQFKASPVLLKRTKKEGAANVSVQYGEAFGNRACSALPETTSRYGPTLNQYSPPGSTALGVLDGAHGLLYGPELSFGDQIGQKWPNSTVVKVTMPGSSLGDHWRPDGPLFDKLVTETRAALEQPGSVLSGFVWFQVSDCMLACDQRCKQKSLYVVHIRERDH